MAKLGETFDWDKTPAQAGIGTPGTAGAAGPANLRVGTGSPEGAVTAPVDTIYVNKTNGVLWAKATGSGNTGWTALGA